ncbi:5819_t:CDS:2 [Diversispora eburnea]|uniref:5819_t:CDS:1 n=1 Tax=Diversispora eburnea TaxID=1213867 RepID=A0A9N9BSQ6_9GLOM|nr:5819_t:CDS:2 [Diversispora eburnea]
MDTKNILSSGNVNIDKIIQESQINRNRWKWIPYDNFHVTTKRIADNEYYTLHLIRLRNSSEYRGVVALKELKDYKHNISELIKAIKNTLSWFHSPCFTGFFGISKNLSTHN